MTPAAWAVLAGVASGIAGWFLPRLIARLPERDQDDPVTYAAIASPQRLPVGLAAASAATGLVLGWSRAGEADLPAFLVLGVLGTAMAYVDLRRHLLPDLLTLPALLVGAAMLGAVALLGVADPSTSYPRAWACAGLLGLVYLVMALIVPAGLGLGDVKLAPVLGLYLGWLSWSAPIVATVAAFVVGGLVGVVLLVLRRASRRSSIPFGPAMLLGALGAVAFAEPVTAWYLGRG